MSTWCVCGGGGGCVSVSVCVVLWGGVHVGGCE